MDFRLGTAKRQDTYTDRLDSGLNRVDLTVTSKKKVNSDVKAFSHSLAERMAARIVPNAKGLKHTLMKDMQPCSPERVPRIRILPKEYAMPDTVRMPLPSGSSVIVYNGEMEKAGAHDGADRKYAASVNQ